MAVTVTVCVGSSCHIRGSRTLLQRFAEIIEGRGLKEQVVLAGSFCRERCGETMNWSFNNDEIASATVEEAEQTFFDRLSQAGILR